VCVQCPFQDYSDAFAKYCGDCFENAATWEQSRVCSYDYVVKGSDAAIGAFHQIQKKQSTLFFVTEMDYDNSLLA
jgi:hypothetical protein